MIWSKVRTMTFPDVSLVCASNCAMTDMMAGRQERDNHGLDVVWDGILSLTQFSEKSLEMHKSWSQMSIDWDQSVHHCLEIYKDL